MHCLKAFSIICIASAFYSCASLTGYQDGRALGEGKGEVGLSLNVSQSPDFFNDDDEDDEFLDQNVVFPNFEITGKYGINENFDFGVKLNSNFNFSLTTKYQIIGDKQSKTAMAIGADVGNFALFTNLWNAQIPLYFSVHPNEKIAWYLSPRYIYQFEAVDFASNLNYVGGNTGLLFGSKFKFGFDFGYYRMSNFQDNAVNLFTVGLGGKYVFGGSDKKNDAMPEEKATRKKRK